MRIYSTLFEEGLANTINLLTCALTIVHINNIYVPKIKYYFDSFYIKYQIGPIYIEHRISMMEIQHSDLPLEEFVYNIKRHVLTKYFCEYENKNRLMWDAVYDEIKQDILSTTLNSCKDRCASDYKEPAGDTDE
jgi:hypothetical protein|nr:MAG TPA: hypothetical protein [Caudoviricetes sp.]